MANPNSDTRLSRDITDQVRNMYEKYPYPHYPLLARFRWQDGYLSSSWFSSALFWDRFHTGSALAAKGAMKGSGGRMLLAGCGEMLPHIVRKNEPPSTSLTCVDLSRHSLRRARIRNFLTCGTTNYIGADLNLWLAEGLKEGPRFDHIDSYGVLHHLPNPSTSIHLMAQTLAPGGTMRIMVYNRRARRFIYHLRRALALMGLTPYFAADLARLRAFLTILGKYAPCLAEKFSFLGSHTLESDARLVDTFLHPHETQIDIKQWLEACSSAGLTPLALFDRYAELDDLRNPMWHVPSWQELEVRASDGRYENNLELFLAKPPLDEAPKIHLNSSLRPRQVLGRWSKAAHLKTRLPPTSWFSYEETRSISYPLRMNIWHHFIDHVYGVGRRRYLDPLLSRLPIPAMQRLARLGAILRAQVVSPELCQLMMLPRHPSMDPPQSAAPVDLQDTPIRAHIEQILAARGQRDVKRVDQVLQRLYAAQRGI